MRTGLAAPGSVGINVAGNGLSLSVPNDLQLTDISLQNQASLSVFGAGGGDIVINARNFDMSNSYLFAGIGTGLGNGNTQAGDIRLNTTGAISLNDAYLESSTFGRGNAGNIFIQTPDSVSLEYSDIFSNVEAGGVGKGGSINITSNSLSLQDASQLQTFIRRADINLNRPAGRGDAGNVNINVRDAVNFTDFASIPLSNSQVFSGVGSNAVGNGGDIRITAGTLLFQNGGSLQATSGGQGNAGNIFLAANNTVTFDGTGSSGLPSSANTFAENNNGGNIQVKTGSLFLTNGGEINSSIQGKGNAGNITIDARDVVKIDGVGKNVPSSQLSSSLLNGEGRGGDIQITTDTLKVSNGGYITSGGTTNGKGNAGNIIINAHDTVTFDSADLSSILVGYGGNGGDIRLTTGSLSLTNSIIGASTYGYGNSGNVMIDARDSVSLNGVITGVLSTVESGAVGNGGNIRLTTGSLSLTNGAQLSAYTIGQGNAGSVIVNARDRINLDNSGFYVGSSGLGRAGNLDVTARSIQLDNKGIFSAQTTLGNGGNITLTLQDLLLLRHNSVISASAGTSLAGGDGGNITINAPSGFIVTSPNENSDIIANAFSGQGGKVTINATGIYEIAPLSRQDLQRLRPQDLDPRQLPTNDITAVSQQNPDLSGTVQIRTPDIDPSHGLVTLPTVTENAPKLVSSSCAAFDEKSGGSNFAVTGRGGLPPNPDEPLTSDVVWTDTRLPATTLQQHQHKRHAAKPKPKPIAIIPATGWVLNDKGEVTLISSATNATSSPTPTGCPVR